MFSVGSKTQPLFDRRWQGALSDYVTAIAWSTQKLAACSAAGEVAIYDTVNFEQSILQSQNGRSIDCLAFSHDGQFLAVGGQNGDVKIWRLTSTPELVSAIQVSAWVDQMAWSPTENKLAFSLGKYAQVWDAEVGDIVTTLGFDQSSVLNITWHPSGESVSVGGYQGIKIWMAADWDDDPYVVAVPSATIAIAWSPDGKYIASGNLDRTITVLEWENPAPWVMRGFPGKIRQIVWSDQPVMNGAPLLATSSAENVVIWERHEDEAIGWEGRVLGNHDGIVSSIRFQPNSTLLASAGEDGWVVLWRKATQMCQTLNGAPEGFSCLAWHPQGTLLAAGGQQGEIRVWAQASRGKGFGKR